MATQASKSGSGFTSTGPKDERLSWFPALSGTHVSSVWADGGHLRTVELGVWRSSCVWVPHQWRAGALGPEQSRKAEVDSVRDVLRGSEPQQDRVQHELRSAAGRQRAARQHLHGQRGGLRKGVFNRLPAGRNTFQPVYFPDQMLGSVLSGLLLDPSHPGWVCLHPDLLPRGYGVSGAGGGGQHDPRVEHVDHSEPV